MIKIKKDIPLAKYTTFGLGGPARFFVEVRDEQQIIEALDFAGKSGLEYFILGGGSNILVSDQGYKGIIIKLVGEKCLIKGNKVKAAAGTPLANIVNIAVKNGLGGLEWAAGIPGTLGGAIRGNAGAYGQNIGKITEKVKIFDVADSKFKSLSRRECKFDYRSSIFKSKREFVILSAEIVLKPSTRQNVMKKTKEILKKRALNNPKGRSAGSFFMNPVVNNKKIIAEFEKETGESVCGNRIPAGWLIEQANLCGKKIGGAMIAESHGNWIINTGSARAEDVIILVSIIKQQIRDKFGIQLVEEVQLLGF